MAGARALVVWVTIAAATTSAAPPPPRPVDHTTLTGKLVVGYQGWHATANDGSHIGWTHWSNDGRAVPGPLTVHVDAWPDTSNYPPSVLADVNFTLSTGEPAQLFSSHLLATTMLHFQWMRDYHIDGAFLQRFVQGLDSPVIKAARDTVAVHVRAAAEAHGRAFAVEYDVSGVADADVLRMLRADWASTRSLTGSDSYLHHRRKPVVTLWGFGFNDDGHPSTPDTAAAVIAFFRSQNVTLVGGVPTFWRNLTHDARADPRWTDVYFSFDVLHPWLVGRFPDDAGADAELALNILPDAAACKARGVDYLPVVFPGFSWSNMQRDPASSPLNQIPRRSGTFMWHQLDNVLRAAGVDMVFNAMFDEVDEGTAIMKIAATRNDTPVDGSFIYAGIDGDRVRSDWWLYIAGVASDALASAAAWPGAARPALPTALTETQAALAHAGLLGRAPLPFELVSAASALAEGGATVEALCARLVASAEFAADALKPPVLAAQLYEGCLGVAPDAAGLAATVADIRAGRTAQRAAELVECGVTHRFPCPGP